MDELILRDPTEADEAAVWAYRQEFIDSGGRPEGSGGLWESESFAAWLRRVRDNRSPDTVRPGLVPATTLLSVRKSDGRLVGFVDIRHTLNDHLHSFGGHIGYSVRVDERRKGYAKEQLRLALAYCCKALGLDRVLVTCNWDNEGSRRTILANGGVLENEVTEPDGTVVQRYWVALH